MKTSSLRILITGICLSGLALLHAADEPGRRPVKGAVLLAYARENQLEMLVGQYDPATRQYLSANHAFIPPGYRSAFTLFGMRGKIQGVRLDEAFETRRDVQPWEWNVPISTWDFSETHTALAVSGDRPNVPRPVEIHPLNESDAIAAVSAFLKEHHVDEAHPRVTQVLRTDLDGDGTRALIVCANSDNAALQDDAAAAVYSVALLVTGVDGKPVVYPLRTAASYKPASRSVDEQERLYGRLGYYQVLALTDVDQDGRPEIAILNDNRQEGPEVDVYTFRAGQVKQVLSTRKLYL